MVKKFAHKMSSQWVISSRMETSTKNNICEFPSPYLFILIYTLDVTYESICLHDCAHL